MVVLRFVPIQLEATHAPVILVLIYQLMVMDAMVIFHTTDTIYFHLFSLNPL